MRLLDRLKRFLRGPRSFESVAAELSRGLRDGSIVLGPVPPGAPPARPAADGPARPGPGLVDGVGGAPVSDVVA